MKLLIMCLLACLTAGAQNIIRVEYFIDQDKGVGKNTLVNVTPVDNGTFALEANTEGLSKGFHALYVRTMDSNGKWSITGRRTFEVPDFGENAVTLGEYFIDDDPGFGLASPFNITAPSSIVLQNFAANLAGKQPGYRYVYGRTKDNFGHWSQTFRRAFEIIKSFETGKVVMVEYFFAEDKGVGKCDAIALATPQEDGTFSFEIPAGNIPPNADSLFLRVKDGPQDNWSITQYRAGAIVLPLSLLNFTAIKKNGMVQLNWQTVNEMNVSHFNVQRSVNGVDFSAISKVSARGRSGLQTSYDYDDNISQIPDKKIYYRLQMMDRDTRFAYSPVQMVLNGKGFSLALSPNPAITRINAIISVPTYSNLSISIFSLAGQVLYREAFAAVTGQINKQIDISAFAKGNYIMQISSPASTERFSFVKQ